MSDPNIVLWYSRFGGVNTQEEESIRQDQELLELDTCSNVIPDPLGKLVTRDGFSHVRATAISGTPSITGMSHLLRDVTDRFILTGSDGEIYEDSANPPTAKAGGTDFTAGADVLTRFDVHEALLHVVTRQRDLPQTINASGTKADAAGTPPRGVDYKVFGRRGHMFSPTYSGTTYLERLMFNSANDDSDAWANPTTINFLNFGRPGSGVEVLGGETYMDHLMTFTQDKVFPVYTTPNALLPFAFQKEIFAEEGGGPDGIHAVVAANERLYWISKNFDVKEMYGMTVKSIGYNLQPFLRGLSDARREFIVGGWEPKYRMVLWAVSGGAGTQHQDVIGLQVDTRQFYFFTLQVNALANRSVSGELRVIGGHYHGLFSNLFNGSTTGDLQAAASLIDADIQTAPMHLGMPGVMKKIPYVAIEFPPVGSEAVTVQSGLDGGALASFAESNFSPTATNRIGYFTIPAPFETIVLRCRDAVSGDRFRVNRIGFPRPLSTWVER